MDKTETYIKMRLAAIPDLGLGAPILNATFVVNEAVVVDTKGDFYVHADRAPYWCQLERQDQLQAMMGLTLPLEIVSRLMDYFIPKHYKDKREYIASYASMEQLWLAFVMKECYNKVWLTEKEQWGS